MYKVGATLPFEVVLYSVTGAPLTGATVYVNVYNSSDTLIVSGGLATEKAGGRYRYEYASNAAGVWKADFSTAHADADLNGVSCVLLVVPVDFFQTDVSALATSAAVAVIDANVDGIGDALADLDGKVDVLDANVDTAGATLVTLEGKVDVLDANLDVLIGGAGLRSVVVQVYAAETTTPLADVLLAVYAGADMQARGLTNASGQCTVYLNDGVYALRLHKSAVSFPADAVLTVSGDGSATVYGVPVAVPVAGPGQYCMVYADGFDQPSQNPLTTVDGMAQIISLPYEHDGKLHTGDKIAGTFDAVIGRISWQIVHGATVRFRIPILGVNARKVIPAAESVRLTALPDAV